MKKFVTTLLFFSLLSFFGYAQSPGGVAGARAWFKADAGVTSSGDGTDVTNWADASGNGYDVAQGTVGDRPEYYSSTAGKLMNFNPSIDFTNNEFLENNTALMAATSDFSFFVVAVDEATSTTYKTVFACDNSTNNFSFYKFDDATASNGWEIWVHAAGPYMTNPSGIGYSPSGGSNGYYNGANYTTGASTEYTVPQIAAITGKPDGVTSPVTYIDGNQDNFEDFFDPDANYFQELGIGAEVACSGCEAFTGRIPEFIAYDAALSSAQVQKINSYLAIKYGTTLGQGGTNPTFFANDANYDYQASDATVIWNAATNSTYKYHIAGIGRDDGSGLDQEQSQSQNPGFQPIIGNASEFATSNATHTGSFSADNSFLIWGCDGASVKFASPFAFGNNNNRMTRIWKVQESGTVGTVKVAVLQSDIATLSTPTLLVSNDATFDGTDSQTLMVSESIGGLNYWTTTVDFTDGQFFTFAAYTASPGGITGEVVWLKADYGVTSGGNGTDVTNWADASGNGYDVTQGTAGDRPEYYNSTSGKLMNFNPTIDYTNNEFLENNTPLMTATSDFSFFVVEVDEATSTAYKTIFACDDATNNFSFYKQGDATTSNGWEVWVHAAGPYQTNPSGIGYSPAGGSNGYYNGTNYTTGSSTEYTVPQIAAITGTPDGVTSPVTYIDGNQDNFEDFFDPDANYFQELGIGAEVACSGCEPFTGRIPEFFVYDANLSSAQVQKINTYLAIKYGVTLGQGGSNPTFFANQADYDYQATDATVVWDASVNTNFPFDIAGIARDDATALDQRISTSSNPNADVVTISLDNDFTSANQDAARTTAHANDFSYLIWGNDYGATTFSTTYNTTITSRMTRKWKIQQTNFNDQVYLQFTDGDIANSTCYSLIVNTTTAETGWTVLQLAVSEAAGNTCIFGPVTLGANEYFSISNDASPSLTSDLTPADICSGANFTYTPTGGTSYTWSRAIVPGITEGATSGTGSIVPGDAETLTNTTDLPITVTYVYVTSNGSCSNTGENVDVIVNPDAFIGLSSAGGTDGQTLCVNTALTNITYTVTGGGTGATVSALPAGVSGAFAGGVFTISGTPTVAGTTNYTVTTTGTCTQTTATGSIAVEDDDAIALSSAAGTDAQTICINTPVTNITYTVSGGATSAAVSGLPAGVTGAFAGVTFTISGSPTVSGTYNYTVTTSGPCVAATATGTITIDDDDAIALSSAAGTDAQTTCINTPVTNITYTVSGGATSAGVAGLPAGVTGAFAGVTFTISGTPIVTGTYNYTVTTTGPCTVATATGTITVDDDDAMAISSAAGTDAQTICINTPVANITYTVSGGATGAGVSGLPAGVTGAFAGVTFTISGSPTVAGTFNYTVTTTGPCTAATATGTITVNDDDAIALSSAAGTDAQTPCINVAITDITYTVTAGGTGASVSALPPGVSGAFAGGTFTISGTPSAYGTTVYTVTTTGPCVAATATGTITVNPDAAIALTSAVGTDAQTICVNNVISTITYTVTGGGTGAVVTGLPAGISGTYAGGLVTISGTATAAGIYNYTVTTTGSCVQGIATGTITIDDDDAITLSSAAGTDGQTVCINTAVTDITYTVSAGATGAGVSGLPAGLSGAFSGLTFTISGTPTIAGNYNYTVTTTGPCVATTATGTILVDDDDALALSSAAGTDAQTVCINDPITDITYTVSAGATGAGVSGLPAGVSGGFAGLTLTISGTPTAAGTFNYTVTTTGPCVPATAVGSITVNPDASITLSSAVGTDSQSICVNTVLTAITYTLTGETGATVSTLPAGLSGNYAAGVFTISGIPTVSGVYDYTVTTTGLCVQTSTTGNIIVGLSLSSSLATDSQAVCLNSPITDITYIVGGATETASASGLPPGTSSSFVGGTLTISGTPTTEGTYNYTVTTSGVCVVETMVGRIIVGGGLVPGSGDTIQGVCKNEAIVDIHYFIVGDSARVYGLPAGINGTLNASSDTLSISGSSSAEGIYSYTVTTAGGTCDPDSSMFYGEITIGGGLDTSITGGGSNVQGVCKNENIIVVNYKIVGDSAQVYGLPTGISGTLNASSDTLSISGSSSTEGIYSYTVTTAGGTCDPDSSMFYGEITIGGGLDTSITGGGSNVQGVCKNENIIAINYKIVGDSAQVYGLPAGINASLNVSSDTLSISGSSSAEGIYSFTVTTAGGTCDPDSSMFYGEITIGGGLDTSSTGGGSNVQRVCKNENIIAINYKIVGDSARIYGLPTGISGTLNGSSDTLSISGSSTAEGIYSFTVTTAGGTCDPDSSMFYGEITIGGGLDTSITGGGSNVQGVCKNEAIIDIKYKIVGDSAQVYGLPVGISGTLNASSDTLSISGSSSTEGIYSYTVTTAGGTCDPDSSMFYGEITIGGGLDTSITGGGSNVQRVCKNENIIAIHYKIVGDSAQVYGLPAGINASLNVSSDTLSISGSSTAEGIYSYTVTTAGGTCDPDSSMFYGEITIGGGLDTSITGGGSNEQRVCKNEAIKDIIYKIVGGTAQAVGLPAGISATMNGTNDTITISGSSAAEGIYSYTLTTAGGACDPDSALFFGEIIIGGGLDTSSIGSGSNIQTLCKDEAILPINYKIVGDSATVNGLPPGVTGILTNTGNPAEYTISGTPSMAGSFAYTITTVGICSPESSFTGTLTVDEATLSLVTLGTNSQTVCSNNQITDISYSVGGTGTGATVSTLPSGLSSSYDTISGIFTLSGSAGLPEGDHTFTVSPTGGSCPLEPESFTISILNPVAAFEVNQEIGPAPLLVEFTNFSQNATDYFWSFEDGATSNAVDTSYNYVYKGTYTVQLIASNNFQCPDTTSRIITVFNLVIPNVFTPNDDHVNDRFTIDATGLAGMDAEIYNRWGIKIFESHTIQSAWDGINRINNKQSEAGTYYYILTLTYSTGNQVIKTGFVTLIR